MSGSAALTILHVDEGRDWRGGQQQIGFLVAEQREAGHRPLVVCPEGSPLAARLREDDVGCATFPPARSRFRRIARGIAAVRRLVAEHRPDVVHAHNPAAHVMMYAALGSRSRPLRVVTRRLARISRGPWSRLKYRRGADVLIAVSAAVRADLVASGARPERVSVAWSAIDPRRYAAPPARADALRELDLPADARIVGSLGSLVRQKAHAELLEAFPRVAATEPRAHLVIIGEGPLRPRLEERCRSLGIADRVRLTGFRDDLERFVPHMDVMAFPSLYEGMPNAVLDALAAGVPVVATPAGGTPELIGGEVGGLLVPFHSPARLGVALVELLEDPARARRLAESGRRRVLERHVPAVMAALTEDAYRRGLAGAGAGARWSSGGTRAEAPDGAGLRELLDQARDRELLDLEGGRVASSGPTGRGAVRTVALGSRSVVLKKHRRGGLPGRLLGNRADDLWAGTGRARREYRVGRVGRARGAPFPAPVGWLAVRRGPFWQLFSAAEAVPDARAVVPAGEGTPLPRDLLAAIGAAVARQHHAGVRHGDLNVGNLLREGGTGAIRIIDLSGARCAARLGAGARARDLARLERSARRLLGAGSPSARERLRVLAAYVRERRFLEEMADPRACRRALLRATGRRRALFRWRGVPV